MLIGRIRSIARAKRARNARNLPVHAPPGNTAQSAQVNASSLGGPIVVPQRQNSPLPLWIVSGHPLHLNKTIRDRIQRNFEATGIFLNIPYSKRYSSLEIAIISTVTAYGMTPHMARERTRMEIRLLKIVELMLTCKFGLTDLSYVKRMNMPLELGLLLAFGKETLVMTAKPYSALKTISDLNFCDIYHHQRGIRRLVTGLSRWVEQNFSSKRIKTNTLLQRYRRLRRIRKQLGEDFERLTPQEITKLLGVAQDEFQMILSDN